MVNAQTNQKGTRMLRIARLVTAGLTTVVLAALLAIGCGSGYSEEDAKTFCDQDRTAKATSGCVTDAAYNQCVSCYEECGTDCVVGAKCPETYVCKTD